MDDTPRVAQEDGYAARFRLSVVDRHPSPSGSSRWPDLETGAAIRDGQAAGMSGALEAYGGPTEGCLRHKSLRLPHF